MRMTQLIHGGLVLMVMLLTGCADWSYRTIQIGQGPREYSRVLPMEESRKTALGLCSLQTSKTGRTDAIVVLVTEDRRVAAKFWARRMERNWGFGHVESSYELVGELSPKLYGSEGSGPIDTLRSLIVVLTEYRGEKLAMESHAWIAAGLERLMQCWPGDRDAGATSPHLDAKLSQVPGGGTGRMEIDKRGIYQLRYR
jgi:hypothetical protein